MKTRPAVPGSAAPVGGGIGRSIFRMIREALGAIIMTTDPERVRDTLRLLENEPTMRQVTHD